MRPEGGILTAGASSPSERIHLASHHHQQPSPMSSGGASLPPAPAHPSFNLPQPDQWTSHPGYSPALTSASMEAPSTLSGDMSSASEAMRWSAHPQRIGTPVSLPELSAHHHQGEAAVPPLSYNYMVDPSGRPHYQQHRQHQLTYMPTMNPTSQPPQYQGQHMANFVPTSVAYGPYPPQQAYAPSHPGEGAHMMHRGQNDTPHMMYQLPSNMKIER